MISRKSFTIVELLVVITIIVVLAGMIIGGVGGATKKQNEVTIKANLMKLEMALERYKTDNGVYPWTTSQNLKTISEIPSNSDPDKIKYNALLSYETFEATSEDKDGIVQPIYFIPKEVYTTASSPSAVNLSQAGLTNIYYNPSSFQLISTGMDSTTTSDDIYNFEKK
jgi:type II secretory pathway pseudopilin PulG